MEYSYSEQSFENLNSNFSSEFSLHTKLSNFISSGQWNRAKDTLVELLSSQPESAWLHEQMGYTLYSLDELKTAETHYKKAIALQPDFADAYCGLAQVYLSLGRAGSAEDNIRKTLSINPHDDHAWMIFGHLALHFEDPENAITNANRALEINPTNDAARDVIIRAQGELKGSQKKAPLQQIKDFETLLKEAPENDLYHHRIGEIYHEELKNYHQAEFHFRKALTLNPSCERNQTSLIETLRKHDLLLRLLWLPYLPIRLINKFFTAIAEMTFEKITLKSILICIAFTPALFLVKPLIIIGAISFFLFGTVFWPLTKAYEYLTITDIHRSMGKVTFYKGPFAKIHKLPFCLRFSIFILFVITFWSLITLLISSPKYLSIIILSYIAMIIVLFFILSIFIIKDLKLSDPSKHRFHKP